MSGDSLETLGQQAYQKQIWGDYEEAINLYTTAINKFQNDHRILNNRCCCYIECGDYKRALQDAETMINLFPDYNKSYYRKGEILKGLKHYKEAEQAFHKVLSLDKNCEDARQQLLEVQILQLLALPGCTRAKALQAITLTNNITDAERFIRFGSSDTNQLYEDGIFVSDDEDIDAPKAASEYEPLMDPTNPVHSTSLWIGCITETTTEEMLRDLFSKYGKIKSISVYHNRRCAFVNFFDTITPGKAMKGLQGKMFGGKNILIKFPDNTSTNGIHTNGATKRNKAI